MYLRSSERNPKTEGGGRAGIPTGIPSEETCNKYEQQNPESCSSKKRPIGKTRNHDNRDEKSPRGRNKYNQARTVLLQEPEPAVSLGNYPTVVPYSATDLSELDAILPEFPSTTAGRDPPDRGEPARYEQAGATGEGRHVRDYRCASFILLNIQSMNPSASSSCRYKVEELEALVVENKCNGELTAFMALTETWLDSHISDAQIHIDNYVVTRCDRNGRGGGVCLYTHRSLSISEEIKYDDGVCQCLMTLLPNEKMCMIIIYRPPDADTNSFNNVINFIRKNLECICDDSYQLCLTGDLNFPYINWSLHRVTSGSVVTMQKSATEFLKLLSSMMLNQYVLDPTRGNNILDIFCTNDPFLVNCVQVNNTELSDHRIVHLSLSMDIGSGQMPKPVQEANSFAALNFSKADYNSISTDILDQDWNAIKENCTIEEFPKVMTEKILDICQQHVPKRLLQTGKPRIFNTLRRKKKSLQKRLANSTQANVRTRLERELALVYYQIKEAFNDRKDNEERSAISNIKKNPKVFYGYAKSHSKMRNDIAMMRDKTGKLTKDYQEISNILQDQFSSVYSNPESNDLEDPDFLALTGSLLLPESFVITENDIISAAKFLKANSAPGPDGFPAQLIINCCTALAVPLAILWNESFSLSIVPQYYKNSLVCPIHKKDDRVAPENYRPISLTSHVMKTAERVVRRIIVDYLENNNIISNAQHGFRSQRSTLTQLLTHFEKILSGIVEGDETDTIYLDYAKAFDKVDHQMLLKKMMRYGFPTNILNWISSFLIGRRQSVIVKGFHSREAPVLSGVPQGTVLGPVLFIIFINDVDNKIVDSNICFFADDTRISRRIKSLQSKTLLERDLSEVIRWSRINNMELNQRKFELQSYSANPIHISHELPFYPEMYSYKISDTVMLEPKIQLKDLGIVVTSDLSWSTHIATLVTRARGVAAWVLSVFRSRDPNVMLTLYKSLVRGHLEYCCPLWHPSKISDTELLESVQREFTRRIDGYKYFSYWDRLKQLNISSLQRRRERYILIIMWKILHNEVPNPNVQFRTISRLGIQAVVPGLIPNTRATNRSLYDQSFSVIGPTLWNALPGQLTTIQSGTMFKNKLSKLINLLPDEPPVSGYVRAHSNSLPEVLRRASWRWSLM